MNRTRITAQAIDTFAYLVRAAQAILRYPLLDVIHTNNNSPSCKPIIAG